MCLRAAVAKDKAALGDTTHCVSGGTVRSLAHWAVRQRDPCPSSTCLSHWTSLLARRAPSAPDGSGRSVQVHTQQPAAALKSGNGPHLHRPALTARIAHNSNLLHNVFVDAVQVLRAVQRLRQELAAHGMHGRNVCCALLTVQPDGLKSTHLVISSRCPTGRKTIATSLGVAALDTAGRLLRVRVQPPVVAARLACACIRSSAEGTAD
jgi:hypothetical protein